MELDQDAIDGRSSPPSRIWVRVGAGISIALLVCGVLASVWLQPYFRTRGATIRLQSLGAAIEYNESSLSSHVREVWHHLSNRKLAISASGVYCRNDPHRHLSDRDLAQLQALPHLAFLDLRDQPISSNGLRYLQSLRLTALLLPRTNVGGIAHGLAPLTAIRGLRLLDLSQSRITDDDLLDLATLADLQGLDLSRTNITSAGMAHLNKLVGLSTLGLNRTLVTDSLFPHLTKMRHLFALDLKGTPITGAGLDQLASTSIRRLLVSDTRLNDAGLLSLSKLSHLSRLQMSRTSVTPAALSALQNLKELKSLDLCGPAFGDEHLAALVACSSLQSLKISDTQMTPQGFVYLEHFTELTQLEIDGRLLWKPQVIATLRRLPNLASVEFKLSGRMQFDFAEVQDQLGPKIHLFEVTEILPSP